MRSDVDEAEAIQHVTDALQDRYRGVCGRDEVVRAVRECYSHFETQPIRDFVPLLVEREARERLDHLGNGPAGGR